MTSSPIPAHRARPTSTALSAVLASLAALFASSTQAQMPRMELNAGMHRIEAEVAADMPNRMQGLMHRKSLGTNQGMLFVFLQAERHCMWMRNTLIPLSVAFLDEAGRIINIADMQPHSEANHCAAAPARFALEMNQGWFASRGLRPGQKIGGTEKAPSPR